MIKNYFLLKEKRKLVWVELKSILIRDLKKTSKWKEFFLKSFRENDVLFEVFYPQTMLTLATW